MKKLQIYNSFLVTIFRFNNYFTFKNLSRIFFVEIYFIKLFFYYNLIERNFIN